MLADEMNPARTPCRWRRWSTPARCSRTASSWTCCTRGCTPGAPPARRVSCWTASRGRELRCGAPGHVGIAMYHARARTCAHPDRNSTRSPATSNLERAAGKPRTGAMRLHAASVVRSCAAAARQLLSSVASGRNMSLSATTCLCALVRRSKPRRERCTGSLARCSTMPCGSGSCLPCGSLQA